MRQIDDVYEEMKISKLLADFIQAGKPDLQNLRSLKVLEASPSRTNETGRCSRDSASREWSKICITATPGLADDLCD